MTFFALTGEGFGFGALIVLAAAVESLTTVLVARLALGGASSSVSSAFFAFALVAGTVLGSALDLAGSFAITSLMGFTAFGAAAFLTGVVALGLSIALAFLATALGLGGALTGTSGLPSVSAAFK